MVVHGDGSGWPSRAIVVRAAPAREAVDYDGCRQASSQGCAARARISVPYKRTHPMSSLAEKKPTDETSAAASSSAEKQPADPATSAEEEKIVLLSSDGEEFTVDVPIARKSHVLSRVIEFLTRKLKLSRVLEALDKKQDGSAAAEKSAAENEFKEFEVEFFKKLGDKEALFDVILAANYLHAQELLDASCFCAADRIRGLKVQEIRDYFNITNDFTAEENERIIKENAWAFD
ncbi:hypothetical protein QOZ80_5BG0421880 [Eleusine coracana subsp. coracana]|nr:hypothetical protein QOZ80_5BG0421880 [Eleusine coracana subsp. coracana]